MSEWPVEEHIGPAAYRELRRELPSLEARVVLEVVQRFEEIEHCIIELGTWRRKALLTFIAVCDDGIHGR